MNSTTIFINILTLCCLLFAFIKNKEKTIKSLKIALITLLKILPIVFIIIIFIGLLLGFVSESIISKIVGDQAGFWGIIIIALFGAIMHIPSLISFPLAASLLKNGASITAIAAFITTLTMIGIVTLPLEIKELGKKMALLRNGLSFVIGIIIAFIIGIIL